MSNLTPERLAEIERRASRLRDDVIGALKGARLRASIPRREDDTDALAVTLAESDIPDLLAEVRRLRAERDTCIQALDAAANGCQMKEGKSADTSSGLIFRARASAFRMAANLIRRGGR